ncbi:hypothetical protein JIN84_01640 [Luteolibacter yonseiensis]|uniref:Uncharacterized protein n=1 Tax=Luteolibacter yonseiensis TaxID=1144680 RepID=A0A934V9M2_9BACT|nr:hypothetical protein [Luteolibacter yonseiensis]MBK1814310.1 hypothetical protein [Luteolibacter yonseiensis]
MFKRIVYEDWATIVPIISFIATAGVFFIATIRALCLPRHRCDQLASIPLSKTPDEP